MQSKTEKIIEILSLIKKDLIDYCTISDFDIVYHIIFPFLILYTSYLSYKNLLLHFQIETKNE